MAGDELTVRPATPADAESVARVHVESWRVAYRGLLPDRYLDDLSVPDRAVSWRRRIQGLLVDETVLVADRGGAVIGFASAGPTRDGDENPREVGEVYAVYVAPEEWGGGLGRRLLEAAAAALAEAGFVRAALWVLDSNAQARGFYEHVGWATDGATKQERFGAKVTEVRYRRDLGPGA